MPSGRQSRETAKRIYNGRDVRAVCRRRARRVQIRIEEDDEESNPIKSRRKVVKRVVGHRARSSYVVVRVAHAIVPGGRRQVVGSIVVGLTSSSGFQKTTGRKSSRVKSEELNVENSIVDRFLFPYSLSFPTGLARHCRSSGRSIGFSRGRRAKVRPVTL